MDWIPGRFARGGDAGYDIPGDNIEMHPAIKAALSVVDVVAPGAQGRPLALRPGLGWHGRRRIALLVPARHHATIAEARRDQSAVHA